MKNQLLLFALLISVLNLKAQFDTKEFQSLDMQVEQLSHSFWDLDNPVSLAPNNDTQINKSYGSTIAKEKIEVVPYMSGSQVALKKNLLQPAYTLDSIVSAKSNKRFDTVLGGFANMFLGNPSKYQSLGTGFNIDANFSSEKRIFYGLNLSLAFNEIKENFPLDREGNQTSTFLLMFGPSVGKWYSKYNVQFDFNYALLTIGEELENGDSNIIQLNGWSPGLVFNYPLRLGKDLPHQFYEKTFRMQNYLNLSFGVRYLSFSLSEASGPMLQLGVSWRISLKGR